MNDLFDSKFTAKCVHTSHTLNPLNRRHYPEVEFTWMFECMPNFDMLQREKTNHFVHLLMGEQRLQFVLFPQHTA